VGGTIDHFESDRRQRIGLARSKIFLLERAKLLAPLGSVAVHDDIEDGMRAVVRVTLLATKQGALDALARRSGEAAGTVVGQRRPDFARFRRLPIFSGAGQSPGSRFTSWKQHGAYWGAKLARPRSGVRKVYIMIYRMQSLCGC